MIRASHLTKRHGTVAAVDDVSFALRPGAVTALLGPAGAGKSTVLRRMLDLERGGGETLFDGVPYARLKHPLRVAGLLPQAPAFHPGRTARAHLRTVAASHGISRRRVDEVLDWVGLGAVGDRRPAAFTTGIARRLGLAAALLGDPRALLLDAPDAGLDPAGAAWLRGFLQALAAEGRTVLVTGSELDQVAGAAAHVLVLSGGRLVADEAMPVFAARSARAGTIVVRTPHLERLSRVLAQAGAVVVREDATRLAVTGLTPAEIGEHAFRHEIVLHELTARGAPLEEILALLAAGSLDGRAPGAPATPAAPRRARIPAQASVAEIVDDVLAESETVVLQGSEGAR